MAHRGNLAAPEPNPSLKSDSNSSKHRKNITFTSTLSDHPTPNPDLTQPSNPSFMPKHLSSLNISHKPHAPHKHSQTNNPFVGIHLQTKSITSSAIIGPKFDRERKPAKTKRPSKDKPQKCNIEMERLKLENEKRDSDRGVLFEDVKVENEQWRRMLEDDVVKRNSVSSLALCSGGGRRRSFCGSQVDLADVFAVNGVKLVSADMPPFMQIHAVDYARKAFDSMEKFTSKTLASTLKKEFDGVYGPAWHCIVGTNFGSFVTHSVGGFLYLSLDQKLYILLDPCTKSSLKAMTSTINLKKNFNDQV